ncbi:hypothetical protein NPX13_g8489 [Xylaria arbuscula]|uniref:Uncharacterized protein n=1 Tax=Xylaria arbuscula TaxID=114810 RepID=A0A9W8N8C4_9PEZI|nr:hypothetical protein NPX13_g8489 [Xylaria arbuscula]
MAVHNRTSLRGHHDLVTSARQGSRSNTSVQRTARTRRADTEATKNLRRKAARHNDDPLTRAQSLAMGSSAGSDLTGAVTCAQISPHPPAPPHPPVPNPPPPSNRRPCW